MADEVTFKVDFIRISTEDPRPWVKWAEAYRQIGMPPPEHGPWENEPDRAEWFDPTTGWPCLARRGPAGNWCGYVCVPRDHPWYGQAYSDNDYEIQDAIAAHGGITFSASLLAEGDWWFGFDCNHAWDITPGMADHGLGESKYRTLDYVVEQVTLLALQLRELGKTTDDQGQEAQDGLDGPA